MEQVPHFLQARHYKARKVNLGFISCQNLGPSGLKEALFASAEAQNLWSSARPCLLPRPPPPVARLGQRSALERSWLFQTFFAADGGHSAADTFLSSSPDQCLLLLAQGGVGGGAKLAPHHRVFLLNVGEMPLLLPSTLDLAPRLDLQSASPVGGTLEKVELNWWLAPVSLGVASSLVTLLNR